MNSWVWFTLIKECMSNQLLARLRQEKLGVCVLTFTNHCALVRGQVRVSPRKKDYHQLEAVSGRHAKNWCGEPLSLEKCLVPKELDLAEQRRGWKTRECVILAHPRTVASLPWRIRLKIGRTESNRSCFRVQRATCKYKLRMHNNARVCDLGSYSEMALYNAISVS